MFRIAISIVACCLAVVAATTPWCRKLKMMEPTSKVVRSSYRSTIESTPLPDNHPVRLILALHINNRATLEETLYSVSDPTSPQYGKYLSQAELSELLFPPLAARTAVERWVAECGVHPSPLLKVVNLTHDNTWLEVLSVNAKIAAALLNCTIVAHPQDKTVPTCLEGRYYLPSELAPYVSYIPGMKHRSPSPNRSDQSTPPNQSNRMTPVALRTMYNIPLTTMATSATTQATAQFNVHSENAYSPSDLKQFHLKYGVQGSPLPTVQNIGGNDPTHPGTEGSLDLQYITGVAGGETTTTFWNTNKTCSFEQWIVDVLNAPHPPSVHSVSYDDWEEQDNIEMMDRGDIEFMKAGVRGLSLLFSSGDFGTGCNASALPAKFAPMWPPCSPYVTSVGGTTFAADGVTETSWDHSGGGFAFESSLHPRPTYQNKAVNQYLLSQKKKGTLPDQSLFNSSNRGFPDVSAMALNYAVVVNGVETALSGTSASTPVWAAIVSLLNDERIKHQKPTMGFLNPFLYQLKNDGSLNSIQTGANDAFSCFDGDGFQADQGWSPVTGLGTANFSNLVIAAMEVV